MIVALAELVLVVLVARAARPGWVGGPGRLARGRAGRACPRGTGRSWRPRSSGRAGFPAHDEVDGVTRVLLRRTYTGLDGRPAVLEERVLETFPAQDPAWEALFTEAMSRARFRCAYLNAEESP